MDARAAGVASQLVAFLREPARFRPAYIHGQAELPDGQVVLKFALGRFGADSQRQLAPFDQAELVDAACAFVRQVCLWERATHYQVLCLPRDARAGEIRENYRLLMALLHPDRQAARAPAWPTGCAQRVNEAYSTLSDEAARAAYDASLHKAHAGIPHEPFPAGPRHAVAHRRSRDVVRPLIVVTGVVAALFVVQSWWMADVPSHYAVLERSASRTTPQWMKHAFSETLPRFLGIAPPTFEPLEKLPPSDPVRRLAGWVPDSDAGRAEAPSPSAAAAPSAAAPRVDAVAPVAAPASPSIPAPAPARDRPPPGLVLAQSPPPAPAKAPAAMPAAASSPGSQDIEILVGRLVSYYEQGDADGLMSLFVAGEPGFWKGMRTRGAYADFFRATKQRRLRMNQLNWRGTQDAAVARGDATLLAEYSDGSRLERRIDVEIDIAVREGRTGITRLSLFPDAAK